MRPFFIFAGIALIGGYTASVSWGDVVVLKNKRTIEGIIVSETEEEITLDVGFTTTALEKNEVEKIERSDEEGKHRIIRRYRKDYLETGRWIPKGAEELFQKFKELRERREEALASKNRKGALEGRFEEGSSEMVHLRNQLTGTSQRLKGLRPREDPLTYNQTVAEMNVLTVHLSEKVEQLRKMTGDIQDLDGEMIRYRSALSEFKNLFQEKSAFSPASDEVDQDFYQALTEKLFDMDSEFRHDVASLKRKGSEILVEARFNDRVTSSLIVDTGAAVTVISRSLAERIGIHPSAITDTVDLTMADGSVVKGKRVMMESLAVGSARAEKTPVAILDSFPESGAEGVLGMTFLRKFVFTIDSQKNELVFESLK